MSILKQIIRQWCNDVPVKAIVRNTQVSRNTVKEYLSKIRDQKLSCAELLELEDHQLAELLTTSLQSNDRHEQLLELLPDMMIQLKETGVNRWVLWNEYKSRYPTGYQYSQFCYHMRAWHQTQQATLHIEERPGDKLYIDFSGKHLHWVDRSTGEIRPAEVFVAVLGYSQMTYVEACTDQAQGSFIEALNNALHYLGGVPRAIVPDNMKTAVIKADKYEPTINETLCEFADHYQTAILPTRSGKPRDKALVEQAVRTVYSRIFAPLRHQTFYSVEEINQAIREQLETYNTMLFQGKDHSRSDRFKEEKPLLGPLASERFDVRRSRWMQVMKNCHIRLWDDKHYYSVPYRFIGKKVKVTYTPKEVSIYYNYQRIAFHLRDYRQYGYTTIKEHLPSTHQFVSDWNAEKFISWAKDIDPTVGKYITEVIAGKAYPEQAFKSCLGILSMAKKVGRSRLIAACQRADHFGAYNYKIIEGIITNKLDQQPLPGKQLTMELPLHHNIRGPKDYQ